MTSSNQGDDDTIHVKRRRPAGPSDSGPRERAEAPQREQPDESGAGERPGEQKRTGARPTGGTGPGRRRIRTSFLRSTRGGGGCLKSPLLIGILLVVVVLFFLLRSCGSSGSRRD